MTPKELKTIRQQLGLTQAELAPLLGYADAMSVSRLETGARDIPWHIGQLMLCRQEITRLKEAVAYLSE